MGELKVMYCRNCDGAMLSTDNRFVCKKCGSRYVLDVRKSKLVAEPVRQEHDSLNYDERTDNDYESNILS